MTAITATQYAKMAGVAREFESMFVSKMLESATQELQTKGTFFGGNGEATFRTMLNQEYGKSIAQHGGFGIADAVLREMVRMQEAQR